MSQLQPQDIVFAVDTYADITAADNKTPEVEVVAYTGGLLSLPNFPHPAVINIAGVRAMDSQQLPLLRDHEQNRVVGHSRPIIGKNELRASGKLSVPGEERDELVAASRDDFRWQMSVGGRIPDIRKNVQTIPNGKQVRVNGQTFTGPLVVVNAFLWKETSFVAVGADEGRASASIAAAQVSRVVPMTKFDEWLEEQGINSEDLNASQVANLEAAYKAMLKPTELPPAPPAPVQPVEIDTDKIIEAAAKAATVASQRDRRIDRLFASYSDTSLSEADVTKLREDVEAGLVTEDRAHLQLLQAARGAGQTFNVPVQAASSRGENYALELEAAVNLTAGFDGEEIIASYVKGGVPEEVAEQSVERSERLGPKGLKSVLHAVCNQEGHHTEGIDDTAIRCAMRASERALADNPDGYGFDHIRAASGGFSSVVLPGILSRLANKAMLAAYAEADNGGVATEIASVTSTNDFKKFTRYRMTESGIMEPVPGTAEIPHGNLIEEEYENQVETYGKILALSRQMMRNDDLDAFLQIPRMIGRMGRHALEQITITTLVDAPTNAGAGTTEFFHGAARGNQEPNYLSGAGTALGLDSLEQAYEYFLNQVDADGKPIMIDPAQLLVTNQNIIQARKLFTDTQYRLGSGTAQDELINNQWEGMFTPIKSAYLHRLGATPSSTQWYLMNSPNLDVSALQIAFLDGQRTPVINQSETSFNTLGMQMRGYFDFGVALQDPRAIVKVEGLA